MLPYSIYIHSPFCRSRCAYCDFNTYVGLNSLIPAYMQALKQEIEYVARIAGERLPIHTIYLGGGTPSLLDPSAIAGLLDVIASCFEILPDPEITIEANPGTLSLSSLRELWQFGVNRLSLGVQSSHRGELQLLGREHDFLDVIHAVAWAHQAGFDNINLDLIFGLPYQTMQSWLLTLDRVLGLQPKHFSLYALTIEADTPMGNWVKRGLLEEPDLDLAADMYEAASVRLCEAGYRQYEISNWEWHRMGQQGTACRHNLQYWHNLPYMGFGAGAHGYAGGFRVANESKPFDYVRRISHASTNPMLEFPHSPATTQSERIDHTSEMAETMMLGMRLVREGVSAKGFYERFGITLEQMYGSQIEKLERLGLVEWAGESGECLRLTKAGRLLGNQVFMEFL